ncbi:MAG: P1 family peptidase [Bacteroidota bacterium]
MNSINDIFKIKNLRIGQAQDQEAATGCTVLLFEEGATVGVDVCGAAPGSRELALLEPGNLVEKVHAIVLSGGSAFGLASMDGVVNYLEEQGIGYDTGTARVPIVCGTVLYDLAIGSARIRPDHAMGYRAAQSANRNDFLEGNYGAGTGAVIGKASGMGNATKSGIGCATLTFDNGLVVSAIVAVNALGDVYEKDRIIAGMRYPKGTTWADTEQYILNGYQTEIFTGANTTLGVIVTNAQLTKAQARRLAQTTHDAYARCIRPVHTLYDGDAIFAAATGELPFTDQLFLSVAANRAMEQAIVRAVRAAEDLDGVKAMD